jgi:hypothetical protein
MLRRDVDRLHLTTGDSVQASLPPGSVRIFQIRANL